MARNVRNVSLGENCGLSMMMFSDSATSVLPRLPSVNFSTLLLLNPSSFVSLTYSILFARSLYSGIRSGHGDVATCSFGGCDDAVILGCIERDVADPTAAFLGEHPRVAGAGANWNHKFKKFYNRWTHRDRHYGSG